MKGWISLKQDLEKAYNRVTWVFLEQMLQQIGFHHSLVQLIMFYVPSASLLVFFLCMEVLRLSIQKEVVRKGWKPLKASGSGIGISHLFFADDLLLF